MGERALGRMKPEHLEWASLGALSTAAAFFLGMLTALIGALAWSHRRAYEKGRADQRSRAQAAALEALHREMDDMETRLRAEMAAGFAAVHRRLDQHLDKRG